jgi:tight adherence protein C
MDEIGLVVGAAFIAVTCLFLVVGVLFSGRSAVSVRVDELSQERSVSRRTATGVSASAFSGSLANRSLKTDNEKDAANLVDRIMQAGFYKKRAVILYNVIRICLAVLPMAIGFAAYRFGYVNLQWGLIYGVLASAFGTLAPSFWLDYRKAQRQTAIRRALPDALDVIVICVEAGLSLPAAMSRVSKELGTAHPMLAKEMAICQREIQLGASSGEALRRLAQRFDLAEVRSLASVVHQAERFGASIVQALRVHAETLRIKRFQLAEEKAQKAAVKLVFPTILCIFPALFIVLAGPAVYRIFGMFEKMAG